MSPRSGRSLSATAAPGRSQICCSAIISIRPKIRCGAEICCTVTLGGDHASGAGDRTGTDRSVPRCTSVVARSAGRTRKRRRAGARRPACTGRRRQAHRARRVGEGCLPARRPTAHLADQRPCTPATRRRQRWREPLAVLVAEPISLGARKLLRAKRVGYFDCEVRVDCPLARGIEHASGFSPARRLHVRGRARSPGS